MSNYDWNDREDGWHESYLIPAPVVLPVGVPSCDRCAQVAPVRILTRQGMLCRACGEQFVAAQRARVLAIAASEGLRFRQRREALAQARMQEE